MNSSRLVYSEDVFGILTLVEFVGTACVLVPKIIFYNTK